jgi:arginase
VPRHGRFRPEPVHDEPDGETCQSDPDEDRNRATRRRVHRGPYDGARNVDSAVAAGEARFFIIMAHPTLLGVCYDAASSYLRGAADGPSAIRAALESSHTNGWSEAMRDVVGTCLRDAGDVALAPGSERDDIEAAVARVRSQGGRVIALGGDHSISYPLIRATARAAGVFTVLHFDAHPDLYPEFEGDRYSHACPFARVMEEGLTARLVQVGIRAMNDAGAEQARRFGVEVIDMRAWSRGARPVIEGPVYLSLDLDVFDPGFAPGVSHHEAGGLSPREVLTVIQDLDGPLVGADVVELNPLRDPSGITAVLAAKLVKEIADRMMLSA